MSLTRLAVALGAGNEIRRMFTEIPYESIEVVINPGMDDIIKVGTAAGLKKGWCEETAGRMKEMIGEQLREYLHHVTVGE